jgi:hypothetical protein
LRLFVCLTVGDGQIVACVCPIPYHLHHHLMKWTVPCLGPYDENASPVLPVLGLWFHRTCRAHQFILLQNIIVQVVHLCTAPLRLFNYFPCKCRTQWLRGLRHELSPLARTLGFWVRMPLEAWMSVCAFILCLYCYVCR